MLFEPRFAPVRAEAAVRSALEVHGVVLDYTPASLARVDDLLDALRRLDPRATVVLDVFDLGCYVGEVVIRNLGGAWKRGADARPAIFAKEPLVVELTLPTGTPGRAVCTPIAKVFERYKNGAVDDVPFFFSSVKLALLDLRS